MWTISAGEVRDSDALLVDALPEKAIPQLQEILAKAMRNSPRLIDAGFGLEQANTGVTSARAPMLPNASGSFGYSESLNHYDYSAFNTPDGTPVAARTSKGKVQVLNYNVGISQPIYQWGALEKGYQSAQLQRAIAGRNIGEARRLLVIEVRRAYFGLIGAANGKAAERVTLENLEKERDFVKQQQADGFVTASAASSADERIKNFKFQLRRSDNSYEEQWAAFRQLTGIVDFTSSTVLPKEIPAISADLSPVLQSLLQLSSDYLPANLLNADDSIHAERLNYEITSTRLRPKLGVSLNATRGYNTPNNIELYGGPFVLTSYGVSANVNWNIFDGYSTQAAKKSSLIRLRQLKNARDQAERDYRDTINSTVFALQMNWESLQKTEEGLRNCRSSVETCKADFESGFAPKRAWDDAKSTVESALQSTNGARADYYLQIVNYLSLRGKDPAVALAPKH